MGTYPTYASGCLNCIEANDGNISLSLGLQTFWVYPQTSYRVSPGKIPRSLPLTLSYPIQPRWAS